MALIDSESWFSYGPTAGSTLTSTDASNAAIRGWSITGPTLTQWSTGAFPGSYSLVQYGDDYMVKTTAEPASSVGWRLKTTTTSVGGFDALYAQFAGTVLVQIRTDSASGAIKIIYNGTVYTTSTIITDGVWHYIEFDHSQQGLFNVNWALSVDGAVVAGHLQDDFWGCTTWQFNGQGASLAAGTSLADFYWSSDAAYGPVRVECVMPAADGTYKQFTPVTGTDRHAMVNQRPQDALTTYNHDNASGDKDSFTNTGLLSTSGTVIGMNIVAVADRALAPAKSLSAFEHDSSGDSATNPTVLNQGTATSFNPTAVQNVRMADSAGTSWTIASVNAAEIGYQITA